MTIAPYLLSGLFAIGVPPENILSADEDIVRQLLACSRPGLIADVVTRRRMDGQTISEIMGEVASECGTIDIGPKDGVSKPKIFGNVNIDGRDGVVVEYEIPWTEDLGSSKIHGSKKVYSIFLKYGDDGIHKEEASAEH